MYVAIKEAGGETLNDDRNGNLVGEQDSTGTINYATGAYRVTFDHTTTGAVTADYYWEDATADGPLDFDTSSTGAGEPKIYSWRCCPSSMWSTGSMSSKPGH
jgi:hypothetical protein